LPVFLAAFLPTFFAGFFATGFVFDFFFLATCNSFGDRGSSINDSFR
jgi:hypothetical protein